KIDGGSLPVDELKAMVMLPKGFDYVADTTNIAGETQDDPRVDGQALTFDLGSRPSHWNDSIEFVVTTVNAKAGEWVTKALLSAKDPSGVAVRSSIAENVVELTQGDWRWLEVAASPKFDSRRVELNEDDKNHLKELVSELKGSQAVSLTCTGHTDSRPIAEENTHEFEDNYALSYARARSVAKYLIDTLGLEPDSVVIEAAADSEPVADNESEQGRHQNRRVDMNICAKKPDVTGVPVLVEKSDRVETAYSGLSLKAKDEAIVESEHEEDHEIASPYGDEAWVDKVQPGTEWLLPLPNHNPPIPSVKLAVKHNPEHVVEMLVNGTVVSELNSDGTAFNAEKTVAITRWRGVDLADGTNELVAVVKSEDGEVIQRLGRSIHFADGPSRGEIDLDKSILIADGTTKPVVAVRLFDRWGKPARPDTLGVLRVDPPYRSWWEVQQLQENTLVAVGSREPLYSVSKDGVAYIELEPTSQTGEVTLHLSMPNNREQEIRTWLKPAPRDWILVGLAEGTLGYNTISDNLQSAEDAGFEDELYEEGRVAFFAKGRIKGEYLLTIAYDSQRDRDETQDSLLGTIDPDRFYTLYGDTTEQYFEAPSQRKLYLKIERNQFVALFGDYETGLTVTELSRYNRSFNGIKSEYYGDRFAYSAFATETNQAFVKDEIQGDGTSGLYRLSRRPIIINSEKLVLEARDRFQSEQILWTRTLSRHVDYDIDYLQGTLFFKEPIPSRDENFNPIFIVVDYESRDSADENTIAGGRGAVKFGQDKLEIGASFIHEGVQGGDGQLYGADLTWKVDEVTELKAEVARSETEAGGPAREGDAFLIELTRRSNQIDGRAYVREQEADFGLGQQRLAESGTRKMGAEGRLRFSEKLSLNGEVYRQRVLSTDADRDVAQAEVRYQNDRNAAGVGLRHATDEDASGTERVSNQAFVSGSTLVLDKKLTIRGSAEVALGGSNESVDFPTRSIVGFDYHLSDQVTLYTEYEFADGSEQDSHMVRFGAKASPWDRAQFSSSVTSQMTENGMRLFSTTGLTQGWQINERWAVDTGLDHSDTLRDPGGEPFNVNVPLASGSISGDFTSFFVGTLYRDDLWTSTSRLEYRTSSLEDRFGFFTGFHREAVAGKGFSASLQYFDSDQSSGLDVVNAETRLSWAYRPVESEWIFLDRLDLIYESQQGDLQDIATWRVVNNFNANWKPNRRTQVGFQYGAKFVRSQVLGNSYSGYTDLIGIDYRRDLSETWDFGLHGSTLHSWRTDVIDYSWGADVGVTLANNLWISLGYNFDGFEDDDFSLSRYTAQGPYIRFRIKADQQSFARLKENLRPDERRVERARK
ncbi:MAG: OmpA family protein, partial [Pseudomonadota bacterium]